MHLHAAGEKQQLVSHLGEVGSWSYSWERGAAEEGNSCLCSWERRAAVDTAGHIAGRGEHLVIHLVEGTAERGIELGERRQLVIQLGEGAVGHIAGRGSSSYSLEGALVIQLGEGQLVIQLGEGTADHTAGRGGSSSYSWKRGQLVIQLGEGAAVIQLGEGRLIIQLVGTVAGYMPAQGRSWSQIWEKKQHITNPGTAAAGHTSPLGLLPFRGGGG